MDYLKLENRTPFPGALHPVARWNDEEERTAEEVIAALENA
jgi:hypothetical protein